MSYFGINPYNIGVAMSNPSIVACKMLLVLKFLVFM